MSGIHRLLWLGPSLQFAVPQVASNTELHSNVWAIALRNQKGTNALLQIRLVRAITAVLLGILSSKFHGGTVAIVEGAIFFQGYRYRAQKAGQGTPIPQMRFGLTSFNAKRMTLWFPLPAPE